MISVRMHRRLLVLAVLLLVTIGHLQGAWALSASGTERQDGSLERVATLHHAHGDHADQSNHAGLTGYGGPHCDGAGCPGCGWCVPITSPSCTCSLLPEAAEGRKSVAEAQPPTPWRPPIGQLSL